MKIKARALGDAFLSLIKREFPIGKDRLKAYLFVNEKSKLDSLKLKFQITSFVPL
jgi:hypothetical protein